MLDNDFLQKAPAMRQRPHTKVARQRLAEIGKRLTRADVHITGDVSARQQYGHVLA
jgi:hypothetical protein